MRRMACRSLCFLSFVAISAAPESATAAQQTSGGTPTLTGVLGRLPIVVFNTATDSGGKPFPLRKLIPDPFFFSPRTPPPRPAPPFRDF